MGYWWDPVSMRGAQIMSFLDFKVSTFGETRQDLILATVHKMNFNLPLFRLRLFTKIAYSEDRNDVHN